MRERIYRMVELSAPGDKVSAAYDYIMMAVIVISLIPLAFKGTTPIFTAIDRAAAALFVADYLLRLITADKRIGKGWASFILYPVTPMAIIDLLAILPTFGALASGFRVLKLFRLFRTLRVFRALKLFRYSKSLSIIIDVIKAQRGPLMAVCVLAGAYIVISALIVFNVEPDTFDNFFEAVYWAAVSLTTMGYGDIYPVTTAGRIVTILSSFVGIAIVALPSGIITAGYMEALHDREK